MIDNKNNYEYEYNPNCTVCHKELGEKWIDHNGVKLCINCAQRTMRILFQDIIGYHNNVSVSLLDIMYHGSEKKQELLNK